MFDVIRTHPELYSSNHCGCSENNVAIEFDDALKINGELNLDKVLIFKPDESLYSSSIMRKKETPEAPDCLILVRCNDKNHYDLYLVELKNVKSPKHLEKDEIVGKFKTIIDNFFIRFDDIFNPVNVNYGKIEFYLICPYPNLSEEEYRKKVRGFELDINSKLLRFYSKAIPIKRHPSLTITPC